MCICMCVCVYVCICICLCVFVYVHACWNHRTQRFLVLVDFVEFSVVWLTQGGAWWQWILAGHALIHVGIKVTNINQDCNMYSWCQHSYFLPHDWFIIMSKIERPSYIVVGGDRYSHWEKFEPINSSKMKEWNKGVKQCFYKRIYTQSLSRTVVPKHGFVPTPIIHLKMSGDLFFLL